mmetsp:Transcript_26338/g.69903  ORF Transcript_26338/g.69903 Transcript_26338/m.69903 type:complete len:241 (+) Transcript_26338:677-1399(+)
MPRVFNAEGVCACSPSLSGEMLPGLPPRAMQQRNRHAGNGVRPRGQPVSVVGPGLSCRSSFSVGRLLLRFEDISTLHGGNGRGGAWWGLCAVRGGTRAGPREQGWRRREEPQLQRHIAHGRRPCELSRQLARPRSGGESVKQGTLALKLLQPLPLSFISRLRGRCYRHLPRISAVMASPATSIARRLLLPWQLALRGWGRGRQRHWLMEDLLLIITPSPGGHRASDAARWLAAAREPARS